VSRSSKKGPFIDPRLLARIEDLGVPVLGMVPRMGEPINDIKGLLEVGDLLASRG